MWVRVILQPDGAIVLVASPVISILPLLLSSNWIAEVIGPQQGWNCTAQSLYSGVSEVGANFNPES